MEKQPLVSVIVPVYKVEKYLDKCVASIVGQTYKNLEVLLVDDGSPDDCGARCGAWVKKDRRVRVIHKENGGLSDARNAGLAVAKGEYISFIDSDDWIEPDFIHMLLSVMEKTDSDIAACGIDTFYEDEPVQPMILRERTESYEQEEALSRLIDDKLRQVVWNKLYKRSTIDGVLFAKGKLHEDEFWSYQIIGNAHRVGVTETPGYHYLQRRESIMGAKYTLRRLDAIEAKEQRQKYLEARFPGLASQGRRNLVFTCLYHGQKVVASLQGEEKQQAMNRLKRVVKDHTLNKEDKKALPVTHKIWYSLMRLNFGAVCALRNLLKIGL